ncbi:MAG: DciA family protein [Candidatus Moraniibacteriota bacterium]
MQDLRDLLKQSALQRVQQPSVLDDQTLFYVFKQLVTREFGAQGGTHLEARYFKDKKLFVAAKSSIWAQELFLEQENFRVLLNKELGQEVVEEIKVESSFAS